ncbi:helix-turn-helix transcriptional regulator [Robiginitomaculum antarcticum]|uniref:helix-turn-helix transcriptional regulator n=1 Tax=Robiginitomaculum antarcticum TaxID=437507 RepID=UPI0003A11C63|nr:helix-turn-helix transcriptional regulator [Robiginitomaculum antarcticum]
MQRFARSTKDVGHILTQYRLAQGLSQAELAKRLNLHQTSISRLESGDTNRVLDLVFRILAMLDLEIEFRPRRKSSAQDIIDMFDE